MLPRPTRTPRAHPPTPPRTQVQIGRETFYDTAIRLEQQRRLQQQTDEGAGVEASGTDRYGENL